MSSNRKVVLVTGAAKRIGRDVALAFAKAGWDVALHYATSRDAAMAVADQAARFGVQALTFNRDLAVEAGVETLVPEVIAQLGRLDCLVNNASLYEHDDVESFDFARLERHVRLNTAAPIALTRALHRHTPEGAQSCAIQLLDQKLARLEPDFLSYTLSKAGLQAATVMLAQALAPRVRVVGVAPGLSLPSGKQTQAVFDDVHRRMPLGRGSTPEDVARTCLFVAESPAMTGTTVVVDGGQHLTSFPPGSRVSS